MALENDIGVKIDHPLQWSETVASEDPSQYDGTYFERCALSTRHLVVRLPRLFHGTGLEDSLIRDVIEPRKWC